LPSVLRYERTYTKSQIGLDTLLRDLVAEKGNFGIAVHVLSGKYQDLASHANGTRSYITASTYKLFVAYAVLKEVEAGRLNWGEIISDSRNAEQCFDDMIVKSDNPCAVNFAKRIGWGTIQSQMHALGLSSTYLSKSPTYDNFSTAIDEVLFLRKLEQAESLQGESRSRLLEAMKRQIYRKGVPAGTGAVVANKVGFLYGLLHDASIVYSPNGAYVLVILSDGSSWSHIADVAKRINTFLAE
jgi:beta-lactamase class A